TEIYTLSLHDALPICQAADCAAKKIQLNAAAGALTFNGLLHLEGHTRENFWRGRIFKASEFNDMSFEDQVRTVYQFSDAKLLDRSEEHTSELQSRSDL